MFRVGMSVIFAFILIIATFWQCRADNEEHLCIWKVLKPCAKKIINITEGPNVAGIRSGCEYQPLNLTIT